MSLRHDDGAAGVTPAQGWAPPKGFTPDGRRLAAGGGSSSLRKEEERWRVCKVEIL